MRDKRSLVAGPRSSSGFYCRHFCGKSSGPILNELIKNITPGIVCLFISAGLPGESVVVEFVVFFCPLHSFFPDTPQPLAESEFIFIHTRDGTITGELDRIRDRSAWMDKRECFFWKKHPLHRRVRLVFIQCGCDAGRSPQRQSHCDDD